MPRISELLSLPERVYQGDFVLSLTSGVLDAKKTVDTYVVTDELAEQFDTALSFIRGAIDSNKSKATYLHGSFGSGKSHFMAVLHLLLHRDIYARSIPKLAPVVTKHNAWTEGRKFLLVPYHMIGAANMESAILGGYAEHVQRIHPNAPIPGVYKSELLIQDARSLRQRIGDAAFFDALNSGERSEGWGTLEDQWTGERFEQAVASPAGSDERSHLVSDLIGRLFASYQSAAASEAGAFIGLDQGLSVISRHAKGLGYDAIVLFLDELVLWLASRAADVDFVHREGQKLAKLVEAQLADRPVPIVSFVARQRDLRELVGETISGSEQLRFSDALKHWEGRFATIKLEDRNLPAIASERVLKPKDEPAREQIDEEFKKTERFRQDVTDTLLTSHGSRLAFRQVYPFSPALVESLVAVSSMLQRERTALRIMLELLVDQRDTLKLGDIVPAGDLWDYVAHGEVVFMDEMRRSFEAARKLYQEQLLPMLEQDPEHPSRKSELARRPWDDAEATKFRNDERLLKTLLLAALVPQVESLKALTGAKLAALNHGTIRSPIAGREGQLVLNKCRGWASRVGQIRISDDPNPTISVVLSGVDTDSILEKVKGEDNLGNQRRKVWEILCEQFGIARTDELRLTDEFLWRGSTRSYEINFANMRELPDVSLRNEGPTWKLIVDFPFDAAGFTPGDDRSRIERFQEEVGGKQLTLAWLPTFFSTESRRELGKLVLLDHALKDERFPGLAAHLSPVDRGSARSLMENQRSQLRQKLVKTLAAAYGIDNPQAGALDTSHDLTTHVYSLDPSFKPQSPIGPNLRAAAEHLISQALDHQYPDHPLFEVEVKPSALKNKVWPELQKAIRSPDGRTLVEQANRTLIRQVVGPLRLAEMHEQHLVPGQFWRNLFLQRHAAVGGDLTVERLNEWIDEPKAAGGLTKELRNLVILAFAEQTNRSFFINGGPMSPTLDDLKREVVLREVNLPAAAEWKKAIALADHVLGTSTSPLLNAINLSKFNDDVRKAATSSREACSRLVTRLQQVLPHWSVDRDASPRYRTAVATHALVDSVSSGRDEPIGALNAAAVPTTAAAMGASLKSAASVTMALDASGWVVFDGLRQIEDDRKPQAQAIVDRLREVLNADEHAMSLGSELPVLQHRAVALLARPLPKPVSVERPTLIPTGDEKRPAGWVMAAEGAQDHLDSAGLDDWVTQVRERLADGGRVSVRWTVYREGRSE